MTEVMIVIHLR